MQFVWRENLSQTSLTDIYFKVLVLKVEISFSVTPVLWLRGRSVAFHTCDWMFPPQSYVGQGTADKKVMKVLLKLKPFTGCKIFLRSESSALKH